MGARYQGSRAVQGSLTNSVGYTQKVPDVTYTVVDQHGYPIRVHDGFASFTTERQANWCAELMTAAFSEGQDDTKERMRELLDVKSKFEDDE